MSNRKMECFENYARALRKLREAQSEVETAELDTAKFLAETNQTHLLKVNWTRLRREAEWENRQT